MHKNRALIASGASLAALLSAAPLAFADSGQLPEGCTQKESTVECTYEFTGDQQVFHVPDGVQKIQVKAIGASGGGYHHGQGAEVSDTLTVESGKPLYVIVGGKPSNDSLDSKGGFNGGGNAQGWGGAGGGATDVRTVALGEVGTLDSRMIIAGGGGGAGVGYPGCDARGGDAGSDGSASCRGDAGGKAGTQSEGGKGGNAGVGRPGEDGTKGSGGNATQGNDAGAGGGGYYGGGSGEDRELSGGAGGGGSSYTINNASPRITDESASVTISYPI